MRCNRHRVCTYVLKLYFEQGGRHGIGSTTRKLTIFLENPKASGNSSLWASLTAFCFDLFCLSVSEPQSSHEAATFIQTSNVCCVMPPAPVPSPPPPFAQRVLPKALKHVLKQADEKTDRSLRRLAVIWEERRVFGGSRLPEDLRSAFGPNGPKGAPGGDEVRAGANSVAPSGCPGGDHSLFEALAALIGALSHGEAVRVWVGFLADLADHPSLGGNHCSDAGFGYRVEY